MKKIIILISLIFIISSCSKEEIKTKKVEENKIACNSPFKIGEVDKTNLKLKGVVISDEIKNISSPMAGTVSYLNCEAGKKVYRKTLIVKITPDYNNPNIANMSIQKASLVSQKANIESLKTTTINNFDNQINSLKGQIDLLKKNIELTKKSGNLSKLDLEKQIETLKDTLKSLEKNLELLKASKKDALQKIEISKKTTYTNIKNIVKDNLLKIDEIFGITPENKDKNDKYEDYLGKKDSILLGEIKKDFRELNFKDITKMSDKEISQFLGQLIDLDTKVQKSIKNSIVNIYFTQTQIDTFYNIFLNYSKNINDLKNAWDSIDNSRNSTLKNFDTQISSLQNQVNQAKNNLENLQKNKLANIDTGNELQLSNLESQLKTLNSNLSNLVSNKKSQVISLDNQILQLNQSISSLNSSLSSRNIYAGVNGIVKQKLSSKGNIVGAGMPLCQIIPNTKSTKIKIYSPVELNIGDKLIFDFNGEKYEIIIENALVYKDAATQNFVYESNYLDRKYFKDGEIVSLKFKDNEAGQTENNKTGQTQRSAPTENKIKNIPVSYIKNRIDGNYIKIKTGSGIIEQKVELGDINGDYVEVNNLKNNILEICK